MEPGLKLPRLPAGPSAGCLSEQKPLGVDSRPGPAGLQQRAPVSGRWLKPAVPLAGRARAFRCGDGRRGAEPAGLPPLTAGRRSPAGDRHSPEGGARPARPPIGGRLIRDASGGAAAGGAPALSLAPPAGGGAAGARRAVSQPRRSALLAAPRGGMAGVSTGEGRPGPLRGW